MILCDYDVPGDRCKLGSAWVAIVSSNAKRLAEAQGQGYSPPDLGVHRGFDQAYGLSLAGLKPCTPKQILCMNC